MHAQANAGHAAVVSLILDNSIANVAQIDKFGKTALHYAAERGYSAIIRTIARSDHRSISEILRQDLTFEMPSESAQRSSAHSTADLLLFYGARLEDITDRRHPSSDSDPLSLTPITSFSCKVASHSIGIPRPGRSQTVCFFGDWPIFSDMASAKREILETQLDCNGIFFSALKRRTQSGVRGMLSIFPDLIGARDGVKNNTALHIAIKMCNEPAVVELLGRPGLDLVARNEDGHTPLRLAAHNDFIYFTQLILRVLLKQYFDLYLEEWMSIFESIKLLKRRCSDVMFQHLVFCVSDDRWADLLHKQTPAESMDSGTAEIGEITEDSPIISSMLKNLKSRMYHTKVERILRSVVTPPRCYTNLVKPLLNCFTEWGPAIERALSEPEGKAEIIMLGHISKGARTEDFAEVFEYARKNEHDKMMEFCLEAWDRNYVEREKRQGLLDHINEKKYTDLFSLLTSRLK
ncbi:hypothetical protein EDC01DRAFT_64218 [Geopyxis carbonaria]|nr:hypothetical protein EDC01DRAFT_64218 [Geopyxis carbonaria]